MLTFLQIVLIAGIILLSPLVYTLAVNAIFKLNDKIVG